MSVFVCSAGDAQLPSSKMMIKTVEKDTKAMEKRYSFLYQFDSSSLPLLSHYRESVLQGLPMKHKPRVSNLNDQVQIV